MVHHFTKMAVAGRRGNTKGQNPEIGPIDLSDRKEKTWGKLHLRRYIGFGLLLDELSLGIDCENSVQWNADLLVGENILKSQRHG